MMIQAFHLTKVHPSGAKVLDDAFFSVPEGSFCVILGESRTGKSTFLKMLAGEDKPTSGTLKVGHQDPYALSGSAKRKWLQEVGMIFADLTLFSEKTVQENIHFALQIKGVHSQDASGAIRSFLNRAGLDHKADLKPEALSSGEQRVVCAIRAMIFKPKLLLADDPFQGLDTKTASALFKFLFELNKSGSTIVLSTQHRAFYEEARQAASVDKIQWVKLEGGKFVPMEEATA